MTKRESTSKKRLELSKLIDHWKKRQAEAERWSRLNPGDPKYPPQIDFCRAEIAKAQEGLTKLRSGTKRQRRAGWGRGF